DAKNGDGTGAGRGHRGTPDLASSTRYGDHGRAGRLVEPPVAGCAADGIGTEEFEEGLLAEVNVVVGAAHALVGDDGRGGLAAALDGDGLSAEGVAVGLGTHEQVRQGNDIDGEILARVVRSTTA